MTDCEVCRRYPAVVQTLVLGTYRVQNVCFECLTGNKPEDTPETHTET